PVSLDVAAEYKQFREWKSGTLAKTLVDGIDPLLVGKNPATDRQLYLTQNHTTGVYQRNPDCILTCALSPSLTAISPWNSYGGRFRAGTAITPDIFAFAAHYPIPVGATIRFITADNTVIEREVVDTDNEFPSAAGVYWDVAIGKLDEDLPESIVPMKLFPEDWLDYFDDHISGTIKSYTIGIPGLAT